MRIAGGVIAIVVGVIQTILMAIAVFATEALDSVMQSDEAQQALDEAAAGGDEAAVAASEAMAEAAGAVSDLGWILWVSLIVSIIVVILGIMICASKNPMNGILVAIIGIALIVLTIVTSGDVLGIIWSALFLLAGVLGYMGAKNDSASAATT